MTVFLVFFSLLVFVSFSVCMCECMHVFMCVCVCVCVWVYFFLQKRWEQVKLKNCFLGTELNMRQQPIPYNRLKTIKVIMDNVAQF